MEHTRISILPDFVFLSLISPSCSRQRFQWSYLLFLGLSMVFYFLGLFPLHHHIKSHLSGVFLLSAISLQNILTQAFLIFQV